MIARTLPARLRQQIEISLDSRFPGALSPRARIQPIQISCGLGPLDEMLRGGLPIGVLTEFVGAECSGKATAALAYMAAVVQAGGVCAWIDASDTLDPESAAACGVDLERLLWIRCGVDKPATPQAPSEAVCGVPSPIVATVQQTRYTGGSSAHLCSGGRDMPQAISALMAAHGGLYDRNVRRDKHMVGTPGAPNRPLSLCSEHREEQVDSDRLPPRRGDNLAIMSRCAEPLPRRMASLPSAERLPSSLSDVFRTGTPTRKPWPALDQAVRATDLLLQAGGFSAIVLDLGSTPPEMAWRIPLATWFRFRTACERTRVSLLLLTQHPCARSSAEVVVRFQSGSLMASNRVMTGARYQGVTERNRSHEEVRVVSIRKPPQSERHGEWKSEAAWAQAK